MSLETFHHFRSFSFVSSFRRIFARLVISCILTLASLALFAVTAVQAQTNPQFVYAANTASHMIYGFQLNPTTGVLTEIAGSPFNERLAPSAMAVNPPGTLLFVANGADNNVSVFQIDTSTGALTEVANSPFSTGIGQNPTDLIVDPSGKFLYVANGGLPEVTGLTDGEIDAYVIDASTGQLTPTPNSTPPNTGAVGPAVPVGIFVHPQGNWLYVAGGTVVNSTPVNTINGYLINHTTGDLNGSGIPIAQYGYLEYATSFAADPAGQFLLNPWHGLENCFDIQTVEINQITGALTLRGGWSSSAYAQQIGATGCQGGVGSGTVDATSTYFYSDAGSFLDTTSAVTPINVPLPSPDNGGLWLADPIGPFVFVSGEGIAVYSIDLSTGAITEVPGSPFGSVEMNTFVVTGSTTVPTGPIAGFTPTDLTFSNTTIGVAGPPQSLQFVNAGNNSLTISSVSLTGPDSADFAIQSNSCASTLAAGANCTISITLTPSITGYEDASLTITDNAPGSPQSSGLYRPGATQTPPQGVLNPTSLTFPQVSLGTTSMSSFTITNSGTETLDFSGITLGGANPGDFTESDNCGSSIAGSGSCKVTITFQPQAAGQRTATVLVADNSASGSPQSLSLTGSAVEPFGLAPSGPTSGTATPTTPAAYTVNFTPAVSFSGTATFSCGITPMPTAQLACAVSPTTLQVTASNSPASTAVKITATYEPNVATRPARGLLFAARRFFSGPGNEAAKVLDFLLLVLCGVSLFAGTALSKIKSSRALIWWSPLRLIAMFGFLAACFVMPACGGGNGGGSQPPPQNFTIQFTATAGTSTQTVNLSLTVQQ